MVLEHQPSLKVNISGEVITSSLGKGRRTPRTGEEGLLLGQRYFGRIRGIRLTATLDLAQMSPFQVSGFTSFLINGLN